MDEVVLILSMVLMLAGVDWALVVSVVALIATIAVSFILHNLATRTRRMESLEEKVTTAAELAIDAKLGQIRAEMETSVRVLQALVSAVQKRLELGEGWFEQLRNSDHSRELATVERIAELQRACIGKDDFGQFRDEVREQLEEIRRQISVKGGRS